jgi:hypothetical protein
VAETKIYWQTGELEILYDEEGNPFLEYNDAKYYLGEFMKIEDSQFHGIMSSTNTSAYAIKLNHSCDGAELFYIG